MIKGVLIAIVTVLLSSAAYAQDFASRFRGEHDTDSNLVCVTISPKMMQEILNCDVEKNKDMLGIISELKSMQMCTSLINGLNYYEQALSIIDKNTGLFEPFLSFDDTTGNCRIVVRKKRDVIIELVMLMQQHERFSLINFTGEMSGEFISKLAETMGGEKPSLD